MLTQLSDKIYLTIRTTTDVTCRPVAPLPATYAQASADGWCLPVFHCCLEDQRLCLRELRGLWCFWLHLFWARFCAWGSLAEADVFLLLFVNIQCSTLLQEDLNALQMLHRRRLSLCQSWQLWIFWQVSHLSVPSHYFWGTGQDLLVDPDILFSRSQERKRPPPLYMSVFWTCRT